MKFFYSKVLCLTNIKASKTPKLKFLRSVAFSIAASLLYHRF
uniref:Uncharacterized protein n=1 Tax=Rhizophora mucronata TaxID=61149 RepID=A0A2P2N8B9_RHIMU